MKRSWLKLFISLSLISFFCFLQGGGSIAAPNQAGLQIYQNNLRLTPERKQKLAYDINQYRNADNIWDTMRSEFTLPHYEDNPRVQSMIRYYMNNQDMLYQSAARAAPYLYYILEQVRQRHLPAEVALLPIFESAYDPNAYSSAGAAGIWQLMPETALDEGIKKNWWYDGRKDVVASTKGALNHLAYLGNFFNGNWLLAIAAYDTGEGNILSSIRRNEKTGRKTDYWNLPIAKETRVYIPKLMALAIIISNPKKYPVQLPYVRNAPYLAQVDVAASINLKQAADFAGLSLKEMKLLNPGFTKTTTAPRSPFKLILPIENIEEFTDNIGHTSLAAKVNYIHHEVKKGETLAVLADKFNTSIDMLKKVNPHAKEKLIPGTRLIVPRNSESMTQTISDSKIKPEIFVADKSQKRKFAETPSIKPVEIALKKPTLVAPPAQTDALAFNVQGHYALQPGDTLYMVRDGDTIEKIAKHYHTSSDTLRIANQLTTKQSIQVGSELVIPTHQRHPTQQYQLTPGDTIYMVRKGDTIETIAERYHTTPDKLRLSNLLASNEVNEGDQLLIPTHV